MFFTKDEVIELSDKKYLVLNATLYEDEVFYQVQEVDESGVNVSGTKKIIAADNDTGELCIEDVIGDAILAELNKIFDNDEAGK